MGRVVLTIMGLLWVAFGLVGVISPVGVLASVDIHLGSPDAFAEARATYGGSQIALGLFFLYCSRAEGTLRTGLIALCLIAAGFGLARTLGIVVDGARGSFTGVALATEVAAVALGWVALGRGKTAAEQPVHV